MTPLVSILIPAYNASPWLGEAIESGLAQTHSRTEIIIVDDGSSDSTLEIARRFEARGIVVSSQPNSGAASARNRAMQMASGEFFQFLDADDLIAPEKISRQLEAIGNDRNKVAAGPWGRFQSNPEEARFTPEKNWTDNPAIDWLCMNFSGQGMMPPAAWLLSREVAERAGPWNESLTLNDDGEYFCRVLLASAGIVFCDRAPSYYRSGLPGSLSRSRSRKAWDSAFRSQVLCAEHLLLAENSSRTNQACANLLARLAYSIYPDAPDIVTACEAKAAAYGGSSLSPEGGRIFQLLSHLIGWKRARIVQTMTGHRPI